MREIRVWYDRNFTKQNYLKVVFMDVGQGDATYFQFKNGTQMLVDCSKDRRVLHALGKQMWFYDRTLDYLVVTHPDLDHYGGCIDVLERYRVKNIIYTGVRKSDSKFWHSFWNRYKRENSNYITIAESKSMKISSSSLHFLYPNQDLSKNRKLPNSKEEISANNTSIVFKVNYLNSSLLMPGDAEHKLEQYLTKEYSTDLQADVYKMGHHGSSGSSKPFFIKKIEPNHSIASAGKDNSFDHPSYRTIKRLKKVGSKIWRTDKDGDITVRIYKNDIKIETES
ncbi:MAG: hypothetical protein BRC22_01795 [Parcubacteria group bacterium QH_9_35_7]|nr:MAG: hypothetical protein BRC22_01795 [Parcubacteria group bacterium QH_9_35_7]